MNEHSDSAYPEHNKLMRVQPQSQAVGEFLESSPYTLCEYVQGESNVVYTHEETDEELSPDAYWALDPYARELYYGAERGRADGYYPVIRPLSEVLAEHYGVDLKALDAEKRDMLEALRNR